jgi:glycosyltransferase involved in cell wall biosynthesis
MRVVVFGVRKPPEAFLQRKYRELRRRGVSVAVVSVHQERWPIVRQLVRAVLRLLVLRPRRLRDVVHASARAAASGHSARGLGRLGQLAAYAAVVGRRPHVVQVEWTSAASHHVALLDLLDCAVVLACRGSDTAIYPQLPKLVRLAESYPAVFARADAVHCVAEAMLEEALPWGLDPSRAEVIHAGVDTSRFAPGPPRDGDEFRVVVVALRRWLKGLEYALVTVARLAAAGVPVRLDVVGGDPTPEIGERSERGRLLFTIEDLGLSDRVRLLGGLSQKRLADLLRETDVVLQASLSEGLSNVVLEAMASGVPVVATDVGGTDEAVTDGVEGFLVPPRDPAAAADALLRLWRDPALRRRLGAAGRARVERDFRVDREAESFLALYRRLRRRRGPVLLEVGVRWPPETFIQRKLRTLAEAGFDARIASTAPAGSPPIRLPGVRFERLPSARERRRRRGYLRDLALLAVRNPRRFVRLRRALETDEAEGRRHVYARLARLNPSVVQFEWVGAALSHLPLADVWRVPFVAATHGAELNIAPHVPRGGRGRRGLPELFGRVAAVHCVSPELAEHAVRLGLDPAKVRLVPPGIDTRTFRPRPNGRRPDGVFRVVTVSQLRWMKGHEYALAAMAELVREGIPAHYHVVGREPVGNAGERGQLARMRYTIDELGLGGRVMLHGYVRYAVVPSLLRRSDAYLQPSLSEGMPNALLEAMACGLPVVATPAGGSGRAIEDGVEGLLVPFRDPQAIAAALARLWREPDLRERLGSAARERVEREFDLAQEAAGHVELYRGLLRT